MKMTNKIVCRICSWRAWALCVALCCCYGTLTQPVLADLTIATQMNVTGIPVDPDNTDPLPSFPVKLTIYFQGGKSRMESSIGSVLIFNNDSDSLYQLDPATKTYRRESIKSFEDIANVLPESMSKWVSITEDMTLDKSIDAAIYFSNLALQTNVTGEAIYESVQHEGPGRGGEGFGGSNGAGLNRDSSAYGDGGEGGHGERGHGEHGRGTIGMRLPMLDISGSLWETHAVTLPKERHEIILPIVLQMVWGGAPFIGDFVEQLDKNHQLPLHSELTVTTSYPNKPDDASPAPVPTKTTTTFDVLSVTEGALPDDLFQVPSGYTKQDGPITLPQLKGPNTGRVHTYSEGRPPLPTKE